MRGSELTVFDGLRGRKIGALEKKLLMMPQAEVPLVEEFGPGVYVRTVLMRKGTFVIGHAHKTKHFNNVFTGKARVLIGEKVAEIVAPCTFLSEAGVRKVLYIEEDMIWQTIHPTEETDPGKLREMLVIESEAFKEHELETMRTQLGLAIQPQIGQGLEHPQCAPSTISGSSSSAGGSHG